MKVCPICGFMNQNEARSCSMCNSEFSPMTYNDSPQIKLKRPIIVLSVALFFVTLILMLPFSLLWDDPQESLSILIPIFLIIYSSAIFFLVKANSSEDYEDSEYNEAYRESYADDADNETGEEADNETGEDADSKTAKDEEKPEDRTEEEGVKAAEPAEEPKIAEKKPEERKVTFDKNITLREISNLISESSSDKLTVSLLIAAAAAGKLIYICTEAEESATRAIAAFTRATAMKAIDVTASEPDAPLTPRFIQIFTAENRDFTKMNSLLIKHSQLSDIAKAIPDVKDYFAKPYQQEDILIDTDKVYGNTNGRSYDVCFQPNYRVFATIQKHAISAMTDAELLSSAAWITVDESAFADALSAEAPTVAVSFDKLAELTDIAEKEFFLSEERWKKLDALEEYLREATGFVLGSSAVSALERFSSVYLALGNDEQDTLDAMVASLILPSLITQLISDKKALDELIKKLDALFTEENVPMCMSFLKAIIFE